MKINDLSGESLDFAMYQHACAVTGEKGSESAFKAGYGEGKFHFHSDKTLLLDLVETYRLNIQFLANEWLASTTSGSAWGETPLIAACRLVLLLNPK